MKDNDTKRLSRLIALLTQLQTKRLITAASLAERFEVSVRTVYRDIKALESAGVPILTKEGKGYSLMEGYRLPPVMFSESEANALITVEQLVLKNKDLSLIEEYQQAINKIKAVLLYSAKDKVEFLEKRLSVSSLQPEINTSYSLVLIQHALIHFHVLYISYFTEHNETETQRQIEPFALHFTLEQNWTLIAYCRLRKDYRMFRLDRIVQIKQTDLKFRPHKLTLQEYLAEKERAFKTPDIPLS